MHTTEPDSIQQDGAEDRRDMAELVAGKPAALSGLMERHARPVFQFLYRMLGDEEDANDLAQETFIRVFRAAASYRPNQKFTTWLYAIAANAAE
jgi:RNA polymerase sigma-70 factor, ECF subfamily